MKQIAKNQFYEMAVDPAKNRLYFTMMGAWEGASSDVPAYLVDWDRTIGELTRGFTALGDFTQAKPAPPEVGALHVAAQEKMVKAGLSKAAEVMPRDAVLKMQIDQLAQKSEMLKMAFASKAEAEAWLDEK